MEDAENVPEFFCLAFDWYILEKWHSPDSMEESAERRKKHIALGIAYAALGHEGRRPYVQRAWNWQNGKLDTSQFRDPAKVPQDLLNAVERNVCADTERSIWVRTDYGPGIDERFPVLVQDFQADAPNPDELPVIQDPHRYDVAELREIYAFFPALLEPDCSAYLDEDGPFDSDEVQNELFAANEPDIDEDDRKTIGLPHFFVADGEAMRSGLLRWLVPDQYGEFPFDERIQPGKLDTVLALKGGYQLWEWREGIEAGFYGTQPEHCTISTWEPPTA